MPDAIGIPESQLREAAKLAVCKINIDSDIRLAMTATIRQYPAPASRPFDPRQYLKPARWAVKDVILRWSMFLVLTEKRKLKTYINHINIQYIWERIQVM